MIEESSSRLLIDNGVVGLEFTVTENGCTLRNIVHKSHGATFGVQSGPGSPFWELELRDRAGAQTIVNSVSNESDFTYVVDEEDGDVSVDFEWQSIPTGGTANADRGQMDVQIQVRLPAESALTYWSGTVDVDDENTTLWQFSFPRFDNLHRVGEPRSEDGLLIPDGWGAYIENPTESDQLAAGVGNSPQDRYPSATWPMQFISFDNQDSGLYLGLHDPTGRAKGMDLDQEGPPDRLPFQVDHYPEDMGRGNSTLQIDYDIAMGVYGGDWYDAAQIYRDWAVDDATWTTEPIAERSDVPSWFRDICLWWTPGFDESVPWGTRDDPDDDEMEDTVSLIRELHERFPVPTGVHWYRWHQIPFDTDYPDYFPTTPGFEDAVEELQSTDLHIMPYINGRIADPNSQAWNEQHLDAAVAKIAAPRVEPSHREHYTEVYGTSSHQLVPTCPSAEEWRETVRDIVRRLHDEVGVDGVYLDQIAAVSPPLCFDPEHGHPLGGGSHSVEAFRDLLAELNIDSGEDPQVALTSECNAEPYMSELSGYLLWHSARTDQVPLFPTVYGDYNITFGREFYESDLDDPTVFASKIAQQFSYGAQLGWITRPVAERLLDSLYAETANFLDEIVSTLSIVRPYVLEGRRLRDPQSPSLAFRELKWDMHHHGTWDIELPVVMASAWQAPTESGVVVTMVNWTADLHTPIWQLGPEQLSSLSASEYTIQDLGSDSEMSFSRVDGDTIELETVIPARSVRVFLIDEATTL